MDQQQTKIDAGAISGASQGANIRSARVIKQFDGITTDGFITSVRWERALRANYDALRDRATLSAENRVLSEEMKALQTALTDADTALSDLKAHYADGQVLARASGSVGLSVPYVGNVYRLASRCCRSIQATSGCHCASLTVSIRVMA